MERGPEVLGYLTTAGGCAAGFTRLRIYNGEHHGWVWPSSHKPLLLCQSHAGKPSPRYTHHLPGRMSKTSVCEATELTSFSKSNCCFSPGYRKRFAAKEPDRKTFPPSPPRLQLHHSRDAGPPVPGSGYALPGWAAAPPADAWWV